MMRATVLLIQRGKINKIGPIISNGTRYHEYSFVAPKAAMSSMLFADAPQVCLTVTRFCSSSKIGGRGHPALAVPNADGIIGENAGTTEVAAEMRVNKTSKPDISTDGKSSAHLTSVSRKTTMQAKPMPQENKADAGARQAQAIGTAQSTQAADAAKAAKATAAQAANEIIEKLPSKEQLEKFFFRVVAFIYDVTYLTGTWTIRFVDQNIIQNDTVQQYWKKFHEKMEQAKKD